MEIWLAEIWLLCLALLICKGGSFSRAFQTRADLNRQQLLQRYAGRPLKGLDRIDALSMVATTLNSYMEEFGKSSIRLGSSSAPESDKTDRSSTSVSTTSTFRGVHRRSKYNPTKRKLRRDLHTNTKNPNKPNKQSHWDMEKIEKDVHSIPHILKLARQGKADEALAKMKLKTSSSHQLLALRDFNLLIKELGDGGYLEHCGEVLKTMKEQNLSPSIVTYSTLVSRAGAWQKVLLAEKYFLLMEQDGLRGDVQAYNSLINAYAKSGLTDKAVDTLQRMDMASPPVLPTVVTFNTLIDSCGRAGKVEMANSMLKEMLNRGLLPDQRSYGSLVHAYCQSGNVNGAVEMVKQMDLENIKPTGVTYSLLLHALGKKGKLDEAFAVLETMKSRGLKPNVVTLSSLVNACGKNGQLERAFLLYEEMSTSEERLGNRPNSITCSSLVDACLKMGQVNRAFEVVKDMRSNGLALTEVTYTSLISELTRLRQMDRILEVVQGEPAEGIPPVISKGSGYFPLSAKGISRKKHGELANDVDINDVDDIWHLSKLDISDSMKAALEDLCMHSEVIEKGLDSLRRIVRDRDFLFSVDRKELTSMQNFQRISFYNTSVEAFDGSFQIVHDALAATSDDDLNSMSSNITSTEHGKTMSRRLLRACGMAVTLGNGLKYIEPILLTENSTKQRGKIINRFREAIKKSNDYSLILKAYEWMKSKNVVLIAPLYNELMKSIQVEKNTMQHDELFRLYLVFQDMRISGAQPDTSTYNTLINSCASAGDIERALETVQAMQDEGVSPDVITYTSLIKACSIKGGVDSLRLAEETFSSMQQRTNHFSTYIKPTEYTYLRLMQTHLVSLSHEGSIDRIWALMNELININGQYDPTQGISVYIWRTCVFAALLEKDIKKALAFLVVIRETTPEGYDSASWSAVEKACVAENLQEKDILRNEINSNRAK